jgi:hypothetical protein
MRAKLVRIHYLNPAGKPGGWGQPFYLNLDISLYDIPGLDEVSRNGRYDSVIIIDDSDMLSMIPRYLIDANKPNPKWTEDSLQVITLGMTLQAYGDHMEEAGAAALENDDYGIPPEFDLLVNMDGYCELKYDVATESYYYDCETYCLWEWKKKVPYNDCPEP